MCVYNTVVCDGSILVSDAMGHGGRYPLVPPGKPGLIKPIILSFRLYDVAKTISSCRFVKMTNTSKTQDPAPGHAK